MRLSAVVESRCYVELERHPAPHTSHQSHQAVPVRGNVTAHRHEIDDLADALRREEPGDENGRIRQIHLLRAEGIDAGTDAIPAAEPVIEQRTEHAGRVETRSAEPVDRTVRRHQRGGLQIADQAMISNERVVIHVRILAM